MHLPYCHNAHEEGQLFWRGNKGGAQEETGEVVKPNLYLQKWKRSQKRRKERITLQTKKKKKKKAQGKREAKGKQAEVVNQETKGDLPAENGKTKNEESLASDEAGEKEAKSD